MDNLEMVRSALRITTTDFDTEIRLLINACVDEMQRLGIKIQGGSGTSQPQIQVAIVAYCKWKFGNNEDKDQWCEIYDRSVAQLKMMTGFTNWGDGENGGCCYGS